MKFLLFGLGSMGKRRIRCLKALGFDNVTGFDKRNDRLQEASIKYGIKTLSDFNGIDFSEYDAFIVSTPPDQHYPYIKLAVEKKKPAFVEASVVIDGLEEVNSEAVKKNVFIAPSCTLKFHPVIRDIKKIVLGGEYGKVTNFTYHSGQYLPDWHPWEKVSDFYVSKKSTGGCREIVPFELTWMVDIFGLPKEVSGYYGRTMDVGSPDIDDTYASIFNYGNFFGTLLVDVVSRYADRSLKLNLEKAFIQWNWDESWFSLYEAERQRWITYRQKEAQAASGYNKNIIEDMYIDELNAFVKAIKDGPSYFPNSLKEDIAVLKILNDIERR